jgi:pyruvate kinase
MQVIPTAPPYADYLAEMASHPQVCGLRLNTVMPLREGPEEALRRLLAFGKPVWVDLKGRQLRVVEAALPPFTEVRVSHPVRVHTPADVFFSDGAEHARLAAVDGDRLILESGPRRVVGPGESVNIVHPSLEISGTLTPTDRAYLETMRAMNLRQVMLSYVEAVSDLEEVRGLLPEAEILVKIETRKGLAFARRYGGSQGRLVAARGDLYVEVLKPHKIIPAMQEIVRADPQAIAASRILDSMAFNPVPVSAEIGDVAWLLSMGYRTFMLGDAVCFRRESLLEALNLLQEISESVEFAPKFQLSTRKTTNEIK